MNTSEKKEEKAIKQMEYWKKRCEAAENLISVMIVPSMQSKPDDKYSLFLDRNAIWQNSKTPQS